MSLEIAFIAIIVLALIYLLILRSRNQSMNKPEEERKTPEEILPEVQQRLKAGEDKIKLIKLVRIETGLGLKEAKDLVEGNPIRNTAVSDPGLQQHVQEMLQSGSGDVKATKYVREQTGLGLKDAKEFVDQVKQNEKG